ncbi:MAG: DUF4349 domain-containing protein [Haloplanus sp.]
MVRRRGLTAALLVLAVLLAGCSGAAGGGGSASSADGGVDVSAGQSTEVKMTRTPMATGAPAADSGGAGGGEGGSSGSGGTDATAAARSRAIVRTGQVRLRVDDFESSRSNLTSAVESRGGYVGDSVQQVHERNDETWTTGRVVLRVPADQYGATMHDIEREGTVVESQTSTKDVTDQIVDLQARLKNLRAERDRLRTLYEEANDTETVLKVERRLSDVQTEIERTEARLQNIQHRVAYSTITVELMERPPDRPVPDQWYDTPVVQAFLASVDGVQVVGRALVVAAAYAAPYLLAFLTPLALAGGALYLFLRRRGTAG